MPGLKKSDHVLMKRRQRLRFLLIFSAIVLHTTRTVAKIILAETSSRPGTSIEISRSFSARGPPQDLFITSGRERGEIMRTRRGAFVRRRCNGYWGVYVWCAACTRVSVVHWLCLEFRNRVIKLELVSIRLPPSEALFSKTSINSRLFDVCLEVYI